METRNVLVPVVGMFALEDRVPVLGLTIAELEDNVFVVPVLGMAELVGSFRLGRIAVHLLRDIVPGPVEIALVCYHAVVECSASVDACLLLLGFFLVAADSLLAEFSSADPFPADSIPEYSNQHVMEAGVALN